MVLPFNDLTKQYTLNTLQAGRRGFLTQISVIAAGVALCRLSPFPVSNEKNASGVEALWARFCECNQGQPYNNKPKQASTEPCKGHEHREGQAIYLAAHDVIATPEWIYWSGKTGTPNDLLVHLCQPGGKPVILNRFELAHLCHSTDISGVASCRLSDIFSSDNTKKQLVKISINNRERPFYNI